MENGKKNSKKLKWGVWKSKGNIGKEIQNELKLARRNKSPQIFLDLFSSLASEGLAFATNAQA